MNCEAYEVLLGEVASHIDNDLYALKRSYRFSKKTDFFFNIIKNDIFPEFVKCLDDFKVELYDFKIKNFLGERKGPVELSRKLTLNAFSDVFSNLSWSVRAGIKKPFSKEKLSSSAFDLKMNTLLGVFRVCYDSYFCSSDPGARLIYEQLNQIYEKLSKIKKGIVFNTFQMQFKFKQSWDASNFKEGYQLKLLDSIIKYNSNANSDKLLEKIFPDNCLVLGSELGLPVLVNLQEIKSKLMQILDANYSAFIMVCVLNKAEDFLIFRIISSDLSFIRKSVKSYNNSLSSIRNKYYLEIKDNIKSKDKIIKKPKKSDYFDSQFRVNLVRKVHDSFIFHEKREMQSALDDFKSKLLLNPWTLNQQTCFLNQNQVDRLISLNLSFDKLISEEDMSLDDQKEKFFKEVLEFLASDIFKSDKQFDNLLEPLRRLDRWFLNRLSEYVSDNTEKFYLLSNAVSNLKKTSDALRSENNIVLSSNVIFSTYKSELDDNLKSFREILDGIEEEFFNYKIKSNKKIPKAFSCLYKNKNKNKNKSQIKPSVLLDVKDKISGVSDILTRVGWIRDNFRSNSYCESSYGESGVLVMEV